MTICLQLDHANYSYGAAKIRVLSDVNADFESRKDVCDNRPIWSGKEHFVVPVGRSGCPL